MLSRETNCPIGNAYYEDMFFYNIKKNPGLVTKEETYIFYFFFIKEDGRIVIMPDF